MCRAEARRTAWIKFINAAAVCHADERRHCTQKIHAIANRRAADGTENRNVDQFHKKTQSWPHRPLLTGMRCGPRRVARIARSHTGRHRQGRVPSSHGHGRRTTWRPLSGSGPGPPAPMWRGGAPRAHRGRLRASRHRNLRVHRAGRGGTVPPPSRDPLSSRARSHEEGP